MVDAEVQYDAYGLPYLSGKTLKGLLNAACAEVLYGLQSSGCALELWQEAADFLFGQPGSGGEMAKMQVGDAQLPADLRACIQEEFRTLSVKHQHKPTTLEAEWGRLRKKNLETLTDVRRQTAMDGKTGAPKHNSLRAMRVIVRETLFVAELNFNQQPDPRAKQLLAAVVCALTRVGTSRNRGLGRVKVALFDQPMYRWDADKPVAVQAVTSNWLAKFAEEVRRECADV
ncbi:MAG: hypothetical protein KC418_18220 [Anaerolineales bacterium]|nr:hypothetical protein [Anaerolineales bacterium]